MSKVLNTITKGLKKIQYNSPVILTFTLISLAVLLLGMATENKTTMQFFAVYKSNMASPSFYVRLFGHIFGHANFSHFFNNFVIILLAGPMLEEKYGSKNMTIMIVITALITGIIQVCFFDTALLGASGVVFMLIILSSFVNLKKGMIPITLILCISVFIGREFYDGLLANDNISQITHIIGGICGASFGFYINRNKLIDSPAAEKTEFAEE